MALVDTAADAVTAEIGYAVDTGVKPVNETLAAGAAIRRHTGAFEKRAMAIRDARRLADTPQIDREGFTLVPHPTAMQDFLDPAELERVYYPEVIALIRAVTGAAEARIFDHTLRTGDVTEREARNIREPVLWAHNDYTEWSGPQRLRELLPDAAERLLARRFAIVQVWRAIDRPIVANPLAIADARSVAPADLLRAERRYPHRVGETYQLLHNPAHRWFYYPRMQRDEALVFKTYDSAADGRARFVPHTSFDDPSAPPDAPPRRSIEVRAFAFF
jgi:hypothetical protein